MLLPSAALTPPDSCWFFGMVLQIEVMKMLDHPNIVRLYETYSEKEKLHLVMEHCEGGDLFDFLMKTVCESCLVVDTECIFIEH